MTVALDVDGCQSLMHRHLEGLGDAGQEFGVEPRGGHRLLVFPLRPLRDRSAGILRSEIETLALVVEFRARRGGRDPLTDVHVHVTHHLRLIAGVLALLDVVGQLGTNVLRDMTRRREQEWDRETLARNQLLSTVLRPFGPHEVKVLRGAYRRDDALAQG